MSFRKGSVVLMIAAFQALSSLNAQTDSTARDTAAEEDYSIYENVSDAGEMKTWCNPKIFDLSPNRFISVGYDYIFKHGFNASAPGEYAEDEDPAMKDYSFATRGLRVTANIPVISRSYLVWQLGGGYTESDYFLNSGAYRYDSTGNDQFYKTLMEDGLRSVNLNTTVFRPLGDKHFLIMQLMAELSGNYSFGDNERKADMSTIRTSGSLLWGKRPHDRLQWAVGVSRTYRAGELNYVPVLMYNYTSSNRKWGTEILLPARAAYRRKFTPRSILLAGYELEGTSYRIMTNDLNARNIELRRSELRVRLDYQRQLRGFIWVSLQAGMRQDISYNTDTLGSGNRDFFRGFFGDQKYLMLNELGLAPYVNLSLNFVSP